MNRTRLAVAVLAALPVGQASLAQSRPSADAVATAFTVVDARGRPLANATVVAASCPLPRIAPFVGATQTKHKTDRDGRAVLMLDPRRLWDAWAAWDTPNDEKRLASVVHRDVAPGRDVRLWCEPVPMPPFFGVSTWLEGWREPRADEHLLFASEEAPAARFRETPSEPGGVVHLPPLPRGVAVALVVDRAGQVLGGARLPNQSGDTLLLASMEFGAEFKRPRDGSVIDIAGPFTDASHARIPDVRIFDALLTSPLLVAPHRLEPSGSPPQWQPTRPFRLLVACAPGFRPSIVGNGSPPVVDGRPWTRLERGEPLAWSVRGWPGPRVPELWLSVAIPERSPIRLGRAASFTLPVEVTMDRPLALPSPPDGVRAFDLWWNDDGVPVPLVVAREGKVPVVLPAIPSMLRRVTLRVRDAAGTAVGDGRVELFPRLVEESRETHWRPDYLVLPPTSVGYPIQSDGTCPLRLPPGTWHVLVSHAERGDGVAEIAIADDAPPEVTADLVLRPWRRVRGRMTDALEWWLRREQRVELEVGAADWRNLGPIDRALVHAAPRGARADRAGRFELRLSRSAPALAIGVVPDRGFSGTAVIPAGDDDAAIELGVAFSVR